MRNPCTGLFVALLSVLVFSSVGLAQTAGPSKTATTTNDQPFDHHDLNGVWGKQSIAEWQKGEPPMTPWELARYKSEKTEYTTPPTLDASDTDPQLRCDPIGIPKPYMMVWPIEIVQTSNEVVILFDMFSNYIEVNMNGKHPENPGHTWFGDSIGHWDGNTLVVDSVGFNDKTWLDERGHTHSDQMHLVQRFTRVDHDHMKFEITVDDPKAYTETWSGDRMFTLNPRGIGVMDEYLCSPSDEQEVIKRVVVPQGAPAAPK